MSKEHSKKSSLSFITQLGLLAEPHTIFPHYVSMFCFLINSFQFLAIYLKSIVHSLNSDSENIDQILKTIINWLLINDLLDFTSQNAISLFVLVLFETFQLLIIILTVYIALTLKSKEMPEHAITVWKILLYMNSLLIFCPHQNIYVGIIGSIVNEGVFFSDDSSVTKAVILALGIVGFLINLGIMVVTRVFFQIRAKTKDLLCVKSGQHFVSDALIMSAIPLLWLDYERQSTQYFVLILLLFYSIARDFLFFKDLPYYHIEVLNVDIKLRAVSTPLIFIALVAKISSYSIYETGISFTFIFWICITPISIFAYCTRLRIIFENIMLNIKTITNLSHLISYPSIIKYISKHRAPLRNRFHSFNYNSFYYLVSKTQIPFKNDENYYKDVLKNYCAILKEIERKKKKFFLLNIQVILNAIKIEGAYMLGYEKLEYELNTRANYSMLTTVLYIKKLLQKRLVKQYIKIDLGKATENTVLHNNSNLDMFKYLESVESYEKIKNLVTSQMIYYSSFLSEFLDDRPSMSKMFQISKDSKKNTRKIQKQWQLLKEKIPINFASPNLVYGTYLILTNSDFEGGTRLLKEYLDFFRRRKFFYEANEISDLTIFSSDNITIEMKGSQRALGKILKCSQSAYTFLGFEPQKLKEQGVNSLLTPFYQKLHDSFLLNHYQTGETRILNSSRIIPVMTATGFAKPSWLNVRLNPHIIDGISYVGIIRPLKTNVKMLIVLENGKIDSISESLAYELNIVNKDVRNRLNLFNLCPEFEDINQAFNMSAFLELRMKLTGNNIITKKMNAQLAAEYMHSKNNLRNEFKGIVEKYTIGSMLKFFKYSASKEHSKNSERKQLYYTVQIFNQYTKEDFVKYVLMEKTSAENIENEEGAGKKKFLRNAEKRESSQAMISRFQRVSPQPSVSGSSRSSNFSTLHNFSSPIYTREALKSRFNGNMPNQIQIGAKKDSSIDINKENSFDFEDIEEKKKKNSKFALKKVSGYGSDNDSKSKNMGDSKKGTERHLDQSEYIVDDELEREFRIFSRHLLEFTDIPEDYKTQREVNIEQRYDDQHPKYYSLVRSLFIFISLAVVAALSTQSLISLNNQSNYSDLLKFSKNFYNAYYWLNMHKIDNQRYIESVTDYNYSTPPSALDILGWEDLLSKMNFTLSQSLYYSRKMSETIDTVPILVRDEIFKQTVTFIEKDPIENLEYKNDLIQSIQILLSYSRENVFNPAAFDGFVIVNYRDGVPKTLDSISNLIKDEIVSLTSDSKYYISLIFNISMILISILLLYGLLLLSRLNFRGFKFLDLVFKIDARNGTETIKIYNKFTDLLQKNYQDIEFIHHFIEIDTNKSIDYAKSVKKFVRKVDTSQAKIFVVRRNVVLIIKLLPLLFFLTFMAVFFNQVILTDLNSISKLNTQILTSFTNLVTTSVIGWMARDIVYENQTTTFEGSPVITEFQTKINLLKNSQKLIQIFTDSQGNIPSEYDAIFSGINCSELFTQNLNGYTTYEEFSDQCYSVSLKSNQIGLSSYLNELSHRIEIFLEEWKNSPRTVSDITTFKNLINELFTFPLQITSGFFFTLIELCLANTNKMSDSILDQSTTFSILNLLFGIVLSVATWIFVFQKVKTRTGEMIQILSMFPSKLLIQNTNTSRQIKSLSQSL